MFVHYKMNKYVFTKKIAKYARKKNEKYLFLKKIN